MSYLDLDDPDVSIAAVLADLLGVDVEQVSAEGFAAEFRSDSTDIVVSWHSSVRIPVGEWLRLFQVDTRDTKA